VPERAEGKRERDRATVVVAVREWAVESVMFTWEDADTVTRAQVASSFTTWLVMLDREAPPGSKALLREVLAEQVTAGGAGARFDRKRKVFVGLRLV
jgi:hypothetical protein